MSRSSSSSSRVQLTASRLLLLLQREATVFFGHVAEKDSERAHDWTGQ